MSGVNKVILVGRVGKDPDVRALNDGTQVANFSIATSESYKDKKTGEKKETTTWHSLVLWRQLAEIAAKYVHKGDLLYIEGKIQNRSYEKDGITRYVTEIVVNNMTMLGSKKHDGQASPAPAPASGGSVADDFISGGVQSSSTDTSADDLPF